MSARWLAPAQKQNAPAAPLAGRILQRQCDCGNHSAAGGECAECRKKRTLQRASSRGTTHGQIGAIPPIVGEVIGLAGQPLRADIRERLERHFAHDFSGVRVHSDRRARLSAEAVQARAYTVGQHIVFGDGFAAGPTDVRLMSHELAHVVQQSRGGGTPGIDGDPALEADANRAASDVVLGRPAQVHGASAAGLAREEKPANEVFYEVNFPDGKKRLSAAEFEAQKQQTLRRMRVDLKLVSDLAEVGRQSQTDMLKDYQGGVESLGDVIRKPKALIGIASDIWANTTPPYLGAWSHPQHTAAAGIAAVDRGDLREAARLLSRANTEYRDAMHEWNSYREKTIGGAESLKSDLELVRDVSFGIALAAGAVVAAPVVAGVVATAGATGLGATALTAGGTALVVGAGGAALGGGSTAAASYAVEGKVDWKETKKQAARFAKQGAVTGLTAGLGTAIGGAGKAAELGKPLVQQALRRCVTEAGVNLSGEVTAEALDRLVPTESPEQKAEAESKAVIPPKARSILVGCVGGALGVPTSKLRSGTAKVADVAVGAGVSYADAKLQGQTNEQALLAAAQSAGTSHLVGMGKKGSEAAKARKESAKAPSAAALDEHLTATSKETEKPPTPPAEADTAAPAHDEVAAKPHDEAAGKPHDEADVKPAERADTDQGHRRDDQPEPPGPATSIDKESGKAKKPTAGGHEVVVGEAGIGVCSPSPCPVIHVEYANELKANPELQKAYEQLQALRKKDPTRAAELADVLIRNLEQVRSNYRGQIEPPSFATEMQRKRIDTVIERASKLSRGSFKVGEFNEYLKSAKSPRELQAMIANMEARVADKVETSRATSETDHQPGTPNKQRLGTATHEQILGRGMEAEGGAIPLDHDRHHVAPKRGGGKLGERIRELLGAAKVSVDDPANGSPLAGQARDPRAVQESSFPHNRAHTKRRLQRLLRDLETVRGDTEATRDVLRRHSQDLYEARTRGSDEGNFRLGPDLDDPDYLPDLDDEKRKPRR